MAARLVRMRRHFEGHVEKEGQSNQWHWQRRMGGWLQTGEEEVKVGRRVMMGIEMLTLDEDPGNLGEEIEEERWDLQ